MITGASRNEGELMANTDEIKITISRLQCMPEDMRVCFSSGCYGRDELIRHVEAEDDVGETIVNAHMGYLRSFKERV